MTDEIERAIRDEVMTLESNGSLWVLAEDYRALLARAEAAEAAGEQAKTLYRESLRRAEKAEIASANHAQFSHEWRGRAEAAEAELHKERARVLSLESEVAALRETHRADIAAGADLETKLAAAQEALAVLDAPTRPAPETVEEAARERVARAIAKDGFGREWDDFLPVNAHDTDQCDLLEYADAALRALAGERKDG